MNLGIRELAGVDLKSAVMLNGNWNRAEIATSLGFQMPIDGAIGWE